MFFGERRRYSKQYYEALDAIGVPLARLPSKLVGATWQRGHQLGLKATESATMLLCCLPTTMKPARGGEADLDIWLRTSTVREEVYRTIKEALKHQPDGEWPTDAQMFEMFAALSRFNESKETEG